MSGTTDYYPVTAIWVHEDPVITYLIIEGETITTTPTHEFYTTEGWAEAKDLGGNSYVVRASGAPGQVWQNISVPIPRLMYDLTVAEAHTFFVGEQQWLVHNCGGYAPTYTANSASHVYSHGHAANSAPQQGKSRFYPTEGGQKFTDEVVNHPNVHVVNQNNGRINYTVDDLGRYVGYDRNGNPTQGGQVIVQGSPVPIWSQWEPFEVVTQYPR